MGKPRLAIFGVTGLAGQDLLQLLESHPEFHRWEWAGLARTPREPIAMSSGREIPVLTVSEMRRFHPDLIFSLLPAKAAREILPEFFPVCQLIIDNSSAFRMDPGVPLVVPEVNGDLIRSDVSLIANPNCSTIQLVVALAPLHRRWKLSRVVVSTYQAVSGAGKEAVQTWLRESFSFFGVPDRWKFLFRSTSPFPGKIAGNVLPQCGEWCSVESTPPVFTREEWKLVYETRKILGIPDLPVLATAVRVPILNCHSEAVYVSLEDAPSSLEEVYAVLKTAPGIVLYELQDFPTPADVDGDVRVHVGRVRPDPWDPHSWFLWVVADNLRKGAVANALQIAEVWLQKTSQPVSEPS